MINFNEEFKKQNYGPIDAGKYEVEIVKTEPKVAASGKKFLNITFRIRDDVDQKFQNRYVWKSLWLDSNEKYANEGWYDTTQLYYLLNTQPNGKTDFNTPDECLVYLAGTPDKKLHLVITVEKVFDESTGEEKNTVSNFKNGTCSPSVWDTTPHATKSISNDSVSLPSDEETPW